ncbi:uncharacterized protein LOC135475616 [Liolophura sinensis]|uniref:uncharacterized protein LOC135475616 n=1 Tax=Liolophura sinensis TaxID=3198878 RepID=UPI0031585908
MATIQTEFLVNETVALLRMTAGDNRFNHSFLKEYNKALDNIERNPSVQILITTGTDKFYSNGLDLQWISEWPEKYSSFRQLLKQTFKRLLTFPMVTVAAINGHAFAGGAMMAMAHDVRVMKSERGWISLNEIHLKMPLPDWMIELVRCKIPSGPVEQFLFVFGKRFTADEAVKERLVNRVCPGKNLIKEAMQLGSDILGKQTFDRMCLQQMKIRKSRGPLDPVNAFSLEEVIHNPCTVWTRIVVHEDKSISNGGCVGQNMLSEDLSNVASSVQVSLNRNQIGLACQTDACPDHYAATTKGRYWLNAALCVLFTLPKPHTSPRVNVTETHTRFVGEKNFAPLPSSP